MGSESMQVNSTHIIFDTKENPFTTYNQTIIGNITTYSSSNDDGEEEMMKKISWGAKEKWRRGEEKGIF